jgi:hypothetical protein
MSTDQIAALEQELSCAREEIARLRGQIAAYAAPGNPEPYMVDDAAYVKAPVAQYLGYVEHSDLLDEWRWDYHPGNPDQGPFISGKAPTRKEAEDALLDMARRRRDWEEG